MNEKCQGSHIYSSARGRYGGFGTSNVIVSIRKNLSGCNNRCGILKDPVGDDVFIDLEINRGNLCFEKCSSDALLFVTCIYNMILY